MGFFASRNARITVNQASLTLSESQLPAAQEFAVKAMPLQIEIGSAPISATDDYVFQLRSNESGTLSLSQDGVVIAAERKVQAGEMLAVKVALKKAETALDYRFTTAKGNAQNDKLLVRKARYADAANLYAAPQGKAENDGSQQHPLDFATAVQSLTPGGTLWLAAGDYPWLSYQP